MKVLHVIPSVSEFSGGPAQAIFPMCLALQEQGTETLIASTDHGFETQPAPNQVTEVQGVNTIFFPSQLGDSFKYSRPLTTWLNNNVAAFDIVHIHAVFNHACIAAARACVKHQVPYVVRPLGTLSPWSMNQKSLRKTLFWQLAGKQMLSRAAAVHYTAKAERVATEKTLGLNRGCVIPLGVSVERNGSSTVIPEVGELSPYVLFLSRLHAKKGLELFLDSFLSVVAREEFAAWRLVVAGDGTPDYVDSLRARVKSRAGEKSVIFTGWLRGEKKAAFLTGAELLSLPSYDENFGLCVMEAMACGVPVLVSPHVNLAEEIENSRAGWIADVDQKALETTLVDVFSSPEERAIRGAAGKRLSSEFTWENVATQLNRLYAQIARS